MKVNPLVPIIMSNVQGLAVQLCMSPEQVLERCTVRELLLYISMLPAQPTAEVGQDSKPDLDEQVANWEAEVGDG